VVEDMHWMRATVRPDHQLARCADEDLMLLVQHGRIDAYEVLHGRVAAAAFEFALRVTRDPALAEEVAQEAFVTIWQRSLQYRPDRGRPRTWMLRIVYNHAIDGLRSSLRHDSRRAWIESGACQATSASIEDEVGLRERTRTLHGMLQRLPIEQREILELAFFGDLSHREIAHALGLPIGTVKGRARLGLGHLREQLDEGVVAQLVAPL
jgi:RNA polymerase sigma-70 factor (ECF subfamily)